MLARHIGTLMLVLLLLAGPSLGQAAISNVSDIVAGSRAAVALIFVKQRDGSIVSGTGFATTGFRLLVTAAHVVESVESMVVRYQDGSIYSADPVFVWHEEDIAFVRPRKMPSRALPVRAAPIRVGETAIVIGYPLVEQLGISQVSVTQGIVSAVRNTVVQLNVTVNPGNSGGPVLDGSGKVIGVVSGALPGTGFAIATPWSLVDKAQSVYSRGLVPVMVTRVGSNQFVTGWVKLGTVVVEAKELARLLGGNVLWDAPSKRLVLAVGNKRLEFTEGSRYMEVDGQRVVLPLPMDSSKQLPLKTVVEVLGGSVAVNMKSFKITVNLTGGSVATQPSAPASPPTGSGVDLGDRTLYPGIGAAGISFGIDFAELSRRLGSPDRRETWRKIAGALYPPVAVYYSRHGLMILLLEGRVWAIGATTSAWILDPYGLRVGDREDQIFDQLGHDYESDSSEGVRSIWYPDMGIGFLTRAGRITLILIFDQ